MIVSKSKNYLDLFRDILSLTNEDPVSVLYVNDISTVSSNKTHPWFKILQDLSANLKFSSKEEISTNVVVKCLQELINNNTASSGALLAIKNEDQKINMKVGAKLNKENCSFTDASGSVTLKSVDDEVNFASIAIDVLDN